MTVLLFLGICAAGAIGSALRLAVDGAIRTRVTSGFPWGTLVINLSGSFLLGVLIGLLGHGLLSPNVELVLGTGLLGGYTTFSTASFETVRLLMSGRVVAGLVNGFGVLVAAVLAAAVGFWLGLIV